MRRGTNTGFNGITKRNRNKGNKASFEAYMTVKGNKIHIDTYSTLNDAVEGRTRFITSLI